MSPVPPGTLLPCPMMLTVKSLDSTCVTNMTIYFMVNKRAQINRDKHRTIHLFIEDCKDNRCFYLEAVAADGLVTGTRIKAMMQAGSRGHQQAAHFGAVTLKHTNTFMTLQQTRQKNTSLFACCIHRKIGISAVLGPTKPLTSKQLLHRHSPPGRRL